MLLFFVLKQMHKSEAAHVIVIVANQHSILHAKALSQETTFVLKRPCIGRQVESDPISGLPGSARCHFRMTTSMTTVQRS